ncbi:MAG TPA: competence/damage-inducible protein A [Pseudobdellovibrionaceae bacterium]|nr:competence/damage-inducible protein A [Pseudobdellovibrionaceae bacterium]
MEKMKVAIFGIGTEITNGQILNRNSHWIAEKLKVLGVDPLLHIAIPDEPELIFSSFQFAQQHCDYFFITGGLGPTSDDLTRNVVSKFLKLPLEWNENLWEELKSLLEIKGVQIRDLHKQQCFFPSSSEILRNTKGTAHGFYCHNKNTHFFVMPGPPSEVESVWENGVTPWLEKILPSFDPSITLAINCTGVPESELAWKIETQLVSCPFEIGYRAHRPHVEVKITYPMSQEQEAAPWKMKLIELLRPYSAT